MPLDRARLLDALAGETAAFAALLRDADLAAPVPACGGWDVADLAVHVGGVHRWGEAIVRTADPQSRPPGQDVEPPARDRDRLLEWYVWSARGIAAALRETPEATPCWGFGPPPRTVEFWVRRQPHETAVHRWDLASAAGLVAELDPELSADGVDEAVRLFVPRQQRLGRLGALPHAIELVRTDGPGRWVLGDGPPRGAVRGPAGSLLLALWQRIGVGDGSLSVDGDASAARALLELPLTP